MEDEHIPVPASKGIHFKGRRPHVAFPPSLASICSIIMELHKVSRWSSGVQGSLADVPQHATCTEARNLQRHAPSEGNLAEATPAWLLFALQTTVHVIQDCRTSACSPGLKPHWAARTCEHMHSARQCLLGHGSLHMTRSPFELIVTA